MALVTLSHFYLLTEYCYMSFFLLSKHPLSVGVGVASHREVRRKHRNTCSVSHVFYLESFLPFSNRRTHVNLSIYAKSLLFSC